MAEHCRNCGSELFAGQRFCRAYGAPSELSPEQTPTQMMPPQPNDWGARGAANTAPANSQNTSPVYAPGGYQPSVPPMYPQTIPPYSPPQKRSPVGWILAFIGMGLFVAVVVAVMLIARAGRRMVGPPNGGTVQIQEPAQPGEDVLSESNADLVVNNGNESSLTKSFALGDNAKFSLRNISGSIVVQSWNQKKAEVKVISKQGPGGAQVYFSNSGGNLSLRTPQGRNNREVRYEITLPRELGRVTLASSNGSIKLTGINAQIFVEGGNGSIELIDVSGVSKVQTTNGKIKAVLLEPSEGLMEFGATNGSIEITVSPDFSADLDASTERGSISIDDHFGITVQKGFMGQQARGAIASGGQPLRIKTTNGSIKLNTPAKESGNGN